MESFVRAFLKAALVWPTVGVALGAAMVFWPMQALVLRPAHAHANLLGFVSMMIFGVGYHVLPRFAGHPLHSHPLAFVHLWLANVGLGLLLFGWTLRLSAFGPGELALRAGTIVAAAGLLLFVYNLWRTLDARKVGVPVGLTAPRRPAGSIHDPNGHT